MSLLDLDDVLPPETPNSRKAGIAGASFQSEGRASPVETSPNSRKAGIAGASTLFEGLDETCDPSPNSRKAGIAGASTHSEGLDEELDPIEAVEEAAAERAAIVQHEAQLASSDAERVRELARKYYAHLMGAGRDDGCCYARVGKFCAEGLRLRAEYFDAAANARPMKRK